MPSIKEQITTPYHKRAPGFLPHHAEALAQWLSDQMTAAKADQKAKGADWAFCP